MSRTPWNIERSTTGSGQAVRVTDADGRDICTSCIGVTTATEGSETTDIIVRAVNAHGDMLTALHLVRMSRGWHYLSDEARSVVNDAIEKGTDPDA